MRLSLSDTFHKNSIVRISGFEIEMPLKKAQLEMISLSSVEINVF